MAKGKSTTIFYCQNCGTESSKWMGQCPACKEWNSFVEEVVSTASLKNLSKSNSGTIKAEPVAITDVTIQEEDKLKPALVNWTEY